MKLFKLPFDTSKLKIKPALEELHAHANKERTLVWGFYTAYSDKTDPDYEHSIQLIEQLRPLVDQVSPDLELAFLRTSTGKQESGIGGLHLDAHKDSRPVQDPNRKEKEHVLRVLFNLGNAPRTLGYHDASLKEIEEKGGTLTEMGYTKVELPESLPMKKLDIPPIEEDGIWVLSFYASLVPHTGIDDEKGHLLAAYGLYEQPQL